MPSENVIEIKNAKFGPNNSFQVTEFRLAKNEKVLLMGPSGCGKTSFLEFLAGVREGSAQKLKVPTPSVVYQDLNLVEDFSIDENLALELPKMAREEAYDQLKSLGLEKSRGMVVKKLSKGEQQRVAVVRALFQNKDVLLADEPSSHLDRKRAEELMTVITKRAKSALVVSHDHHLERFFDRVIQFEELLR